MYYYKFNIADWVLHTNHLTPQEEGIYFRLLNHYYDTEQAIPEETKSVFRRLRLIGMEDKATAILEEYFLLKDHFWTHKRCDKEILAYQAKADTNRENGKRGGRPKRSGHSPKPVNNPKRTQSVNSGNPDITLTKNHKPLTKNQEPLTTNQEPSPPIPPRGKHPRFDEFYSAYPRKSAKQQALKAWNKLKPNDTLINRILDDIPKRVDSGDFDVNDKTHIPHPATYLNGKRWEDEIIQQGVSHGTHQQPGGGKLSSVARVRLRAEQRQRERAEQIRILEAGGEIGSGMDGAQRDVWKSAKQPMGADNAGRLDAPLEGVLIN